MKKEINNKGKGFVAIIIIALLIAITNYLIYPIFISNRMNYVEVPIANKKLSSNTIITKDDIATILIDSSKLPSEIELDVANIIGKYVCNGHAIERNGFFYKESFSTIANNFGNVYSNLNEDEYAYVINIDSKWLFDNLFVSGEYIDILYTQQYKNESGINSYIVGILGNNVKLIDIIFDTSMSKMVLALKEDDVAIFTLANKLSDINKGEIIPLLSFDSIKDHDANNTYFDTYSLKEYLLSTGTVFNK